MNAIFSALNRLWSALPGNQTAHDDSLRANQGSPAAAYSAWRALVSNGDGR